MTDMRVDAIWRYPVKSLAGEQVTETELTLDGVVGDRLVQVRRRSGRVVTSRTRPGLLGLHGTLDDDGTALIDGLPWDDPRSLEAVQAAAGPDSRLVFDDSLERFDILPLLVATDGAISAFGRDTRRLRPNLVISGVPGVAERDWPGALLSIGETVIRLHSLRPRCVMTTFDPDTQEQDVDVLRDIHNRFGGVLALNAWVIRVGAVHVGDEVRLHRSPARPRAQLIGQ
jgi:uncharacterized protein YcbX